MKPPTTQLAAVEPEAIPLEVLPDPGGDGAPLDIEGAWSRAQELWAEATRGAEAIIDLSHCLNNLRMAYENEGRGGDRRGEGFQTSATGRLKKGWQQEVQDRLGITKQTALRLIEKGEFLLRINGIATGEDVEYEDARGEIKLVPATPERQTLAREVLGEVVAGTIAAPRAWAGICGEGSRADIDKRRGDVDYAAVMLRAIRSVKSALRRWPELGPEDRADVEVAWFDLLDHAPDTWKPAPRKGARQ